MPHTISVDHSYPEKQSPNATLAAQEDQFRGQVMVTECSRNSPLSSKARWNAHHVEITICPDILSRLVRESQVSLTDVSPTNAEAKLILWQAFKEALSNPQPKSKQQPTSSGITTDYVLAKDK